MPSKRHEPGLGAARHGEVEDHACHRRRGGSGILIEGDWPKIRQVVVEIHGESEATSGLTRLLRRRGFLTAVEPNPTFPSLALVHRSSVKAGEDAARDGTLRVHPTQSVKAYHLIRVLQVAVGILPRV